MPWEELGDLEPEGLGTTLSLAASQLPLPSQGCGCLGPLASTSKFRLLSELPAAQHPPSLLLQSQGLPGDERVFQWEMAWDCTVLPTGRPDLPACLLPAPCSLLQRSCWSLSRESISRCN